MHLSHSRTHPSRHTVDFNLPTRPALKREHTFKGAVDKVVTSIRRVATTTNLKSHHEVQTTVRASATHKSPLAPDFVLPRGAQISVSRECTKTTLSTSAKNEFLVDELLHNRKERPLWWFNTQRKLEGACNFEHGTCDCQSIPVFADGDDLHPDRSVNDADYMEHFKPLQPRSAIVPDDLPSAHTTAPPSRDDPPPSVNRSKSRSVSFLAARDHQLKTPNADCISDMLKKRAPPTRCRRGSRGAA